MSERGEVKKIKLSKPITINGISYRHMKIEIDHVNYGLDPKTKRLNTKRRSHYSESDIVEFVKLFDREYLMPQRMTETDLIFVADCNSPIKDKNFGKKHRVVISTPRNANINEMMTITIYKVRK